MIQHLNHNCTIENSFGGRRDSRHSRSQDFCCEGALYFYLKPDDLFYSTSSSIYRLTSWINHSHSSPPYKFDFSLSRGVHSLFHAGALTTYPYKLSPQKIKFWLWGVHVHSLAMPMLPGSKRDLLWLQCVLYLQLADMVWLPGFYDLWNSGICSLEVIVRWGVA